MKTYAKLLLLALVLAFTHSAQAQKPAPASKPPDKAARKVIDERLNKLDRAIANLRNLGIRDPAMAEVEIYAKAVHWIIKHNEFFPADAPAWTVEALDRGLLRASLVARGEYPWIDQKGAAVVRAYRSRVDGSVQPYAISAPADYAKDPLKKWRLDVVLHGRDANLTEVKFLHEHDGSKPLPKEQGFIRLDIYGRGNNAYRWAGETDVLEAIESFLRGENARGRGANIDLDHVVLRGFSMGGAGTWHIGLHRPDQWGVLGPGAGFVNTHGYLKNLPAKLPSYQESCLRIYDAIDYADNAYHVPIAAYDGANDPQLAAAQAVEAILKKKKIPMTLLVAPGLGHKFPPEWQQKAEKEYARLVKLPRESARIRFTTYTLKYAACYWVEILALEQHYQKSTVEADRTENGFHIKTSNVRALRLALPDRSWVTADLKVDGQDVATKPYLAARGKSFLLLERQDGKWQVILPETWAGAQLRQPRKTAGLQGPIDDALTSTFLCVRGTGKPWNAGVQKYADADLKRFEAEWSKYLRGTLPVKDDVDITEADIQSNNLILFGDPGSNALIAQALRGLPLKWTVKSITWGGKTYAASEHVPALIFPNPLNPRKYVVLNSGHTFRAADFQGTNALLYPRLGDHALLKLDGKSKDPLAANVAAGGIFDDDWRIKKE